MIEIQHTGYTIKTESVKPEFLKPVSAVGKKEMKNFIFSVIETK
jgi:hypothetical protein